MGFENGSTGGCQCGALRYRISGAARMLYVCHCSDCQKQSASAFGMSLIVERAAFELTRGAEKLRTWDTRGDDGVLKRCAFCPECGTRIYHGSDNDDAPISIKAGSLDDTSGLQPIAQIWLASAQPWISVDRTRYLCFDAEPDDEAELERLWRERNA